MSICKVEYYISERTTPDYWHGPADKYFKSGSAAGDKVRVTCLVGNGTATAWGDEGPSVQDARLPSSKINATAERVGIMYPSALNNALSSPLNIRTRSLCYR